MSNDLTSVYRISVSLNEPIKYSALSEAVAITAERFPYFSVSLRSGIFWHFLELNNLPPRIHAEDKTPCTAFAVTRRNEPLYRIILKGNTISVEFVHILTDGTGALEYLKSLLYTYLKLTGKNISDTGQIILPGSRISEEEYEDSYLKFFQKLPPPEKLVQAWHLPYKRNPRPSFRVLQAEADLGEMLERSRALKVSITEYITAVYFFALQKIYISQTDKSRREKKKLLRIEVPINMRKLLPSTTMRNFSLFLLPEIDVRLGTYTFEEILSSVHHQLKISADVRQISRSLSSNVSYEKLLIVRVLPLFIKKLAIASVYRGLASRRWTGIVTNMGQVSLPAEMEDLVSSLEIIPPPPNPNVKVSCALVSYKDKIMVTFANITPSREVERLMLKHLTDDGIHIKIIKNY